MRVVLVGLALSVAVLVAPAAAVSHPGQVRTDAEHVAEDTAHHDPAMEPKLARRTRAATAADARAAAAAVVANEHEVGSWGPVVNWPVVGIHAALLPNGKVLAYDTVGDARTESFPVHDFTRATVWDPDTGTHTDVRLTGHNVFCSGLAHLSDGTLFLAGGNKNAALDGIAQTYTFDHMTNGWSRGADMAFERWYPTVTPLRNGEMLITEGGPDIPEVRTTAGTLRTLINASLNLPLYPWIHAAPDGRAFYAGPNQTMRALNTDGTGTWQTFAQRDAINRDYGSHALYDIGRILVAGGGFSSADARTININGATPQVTATAPMANGRRQHNLTVLADGSVLATGGNSSGAGLVDLNNGVYVGELWNPATGTWKTLAPETVTRQYHSTALLLPDGRVLSSGGGICGTCDQVGYLAKNAQVFTPPYLFKTDGSGELAPRPTIASAPANVTYAAGFQIDTPDAAAIRKVALVRLGAVTHSVNMEQRYVPLNYTAGSGALTATAPANANIAPPGVYMLFVIDANGVPSVAKMVTVRADTTPPSAPTGLTATAVSTSRIDLTWTASTDNVGVTGYRVERCRGTSCTNFTQIGTTAGLNFASTGLQANTNYRFRVRAFDAAVNLSPYSSIVTRRTLAADTTAPTAPTALTATAASPTQVNLSWTASTDNVGVTGYRVERCQGAACTNFTQVGTPTATTFNDTGRTASTTYRYRVRATDQAGNLSPYSTIATATTPAGTDITPPSTPSALTATATSATQVDLSWAASTDNVGVTGYRVERCAGATCTNFTQVGTPTATSFNDTGLTGSTTYRYRVRASDAAGNLSAYSAIASATTPAAPDTTPPSTPSGVTATAASTTQINLSWTASNDNVGVTGYRVERCQGATCTDFTEVGTPPGTTFNDTDLSPSTTYRYRVRAADQAGNLSTYSTIASATTPAAPDTTPPSAPAGLSATAASSTQVDLSWTASTDDVGVTGYRVERCQGAGCTNFTQIAPPTATAYSDTGLTASTAYRYQVRAADAAGNLSGYSPVAAATTSAAPATPPGLVGAWAFGEGSGTTTADASGNGNHGTITGAAWTTAGRHGNALSFNGLNSLVRVAGATSLNLGSAMTLSAWVRPAITQGGWKTIIQREADAYFLTASGDAPLAPAGGGTLGGDINYVGAPSPSPVNAWTHVALTYDGASLRMYINGAQAAARAAGGAIQSTTNPLWIGGNQPYGEYFQGLIDEARVYNRALTQADIETDMNTPLAWSGLASSL